MNCEYADLFETCTRPATFTVKWRRWGLTHYCAQHHTALTHDNPTDLLETTAA